VADKKPDWLMLVLGLVLGLFLAAVVYLSAGPDSPDEIGKKPGGEIGARQPADEDEDEDEPEQTQRPRFEFYSILPELEVVVPEEDALEDIHTGEVERAAAANERLDADGGARANSRADVARVDPAPAIDAATSYYLQTGSFQRAADAERRKVSLLLMGLRVDVRPVSINGVQWHRVYAGPFRDRTALDDALARLRGQGIDYMIVRAR